VPLCDPASRLRAQALGVGARIVRIVDPALDLRERHLRVELHRPRALPDSERLRAEIVARELVRSRRNVEAVPVPLERVETARQPADHGIALAARRELERKPTDLR